MEKKQLRYITKRAVNVVKEILDNQKKGIENMGTYTIYQKGNLIINIGWLSGYEKEKDLIYENGYGLNIGIKVYSYYDLTDYEYLNSPYYENGEVWETDITLYKGDTKIKNMIKHIEYLIENIEAMQNYYISDDGTIIDYKNSKITDKAIIHCEDEILSEIETNYKCRNKKEELQIWRDRISIHRNNRWYDYFVEDLKGKTIQKFCEKHGLKKVA